MTFGKGLQFFFCITSNSKCIFPGQIQQTKMVFPLSFWAMSKKIYNYLFRLTSKWSDIQNVRHSKMQFLHSFLSLLLFHCYLTSIKITKANRWDKYDVFLTIIFLKTTEFSLNMLLKNQSTLYLDLISLSIKAKCNIISQWLFSFHFFLFILSILNLHY